MLENRHKGSPSTLLSACQVISVILCPKLTWKMPSGEIMLSGKKKKNQPGERVEGKAVLKSAEAEGGIRKSVLRLAWKKWDERNCYDRKKAVHLSDGVLDNSQCKMLQGACKTAIPHIIASYLAKNYYCSNFNRNYLISAIQSTVMVCACTRVFLLSLVKIQCKNYC